jgi:hypothetical protein
MHATLLLLLRSVWCWCSVLILGACAAGGACTSVDAQLEGRQPPSELWWRGPRGEVLVQFENLEAEQLAQQAMSG